MRIPSHKNEMRSKGSLGWLLCLFASLLTAQATAAEPELLQRLASQYSSDIEPIVKRVCHECHAGDTIEGELDLATFAKFEQVRKHLEAWQKIGEMLASEQMPPKDSPQPTAAEKAKLQTWVRELLTFEAAASPGDPGPVVLRRLNNAEYTYTLRDLTGVPTLAPAKEFPADSAAGEGFTNVGSALAMSPALLTKYLDAAKDVAGHAVLLPDGMRFSPSTSRRDWTNESLAQIRSFYDRYSSAGGGSAVNLQGVQFQTNQGGRLPVEPYLLATLQERAALQTGDKTIAQVAQERGLNAKYLGLVWSTLTPNSAHQALPLDALRAAWRTAKAEDAPALAKQVAQWQSALWKFNAVGGVSSINKPQAWQEAVNPLATRQDFRVKIAPPAGNEDVILYLAASNAGDGSQDSAVLWERPRFISPGRQELLLRDVQRVSQVLLEHREQHIAQAAACLNAAGEASTAPEKIDIAALAKKHHVDAALLAGWLKYLGIGGETRLGARIERKAESGANYDFIQGWVGDDALSVVANSSDQHVRIPGNMKPHSIAVHPAPKFSVAVGWQSQAAATLQISGTVQHAHPECGNGVAWSLELRRGGLGQKLAQGIAQGAKEMAIGPLDKVAVRAGDVIALVIDPRDGNHSCDLTQIDLTLHDGAREWNLAKDVSPNILAGNPHSDLRGNQNVWHFYSHPTGSTGASLPAGSLLAKWQVASSPEQAKLAAEVQKLLQTGPAALPKDSPDIALYSELTSLSGPLMMTALDAALATSGENAREAVGKHGLDAKLFGKDLQGQAIDAGSLCVSAPKVLEVRVPAALVAGAEFVTGGTLAGSEQEGSVQLQVLTTPPTSDGLVPGATILAREGSVARQRVQTALDEFRQLFPIALCYTQIVPVDEVVTLTLFYREDDHLRRLMLNDEEVAQLNRYWDELFFIAQEPLELVTAYDQISEFATQDNPAGVIALKPLKQPIYDRASAFKKRLVACEPLQLDALIQFAAQAYRRPLQEHEEQQLRALYASLRAQELPHDEALRLTLARVLVSPAFMYRLEQPGVGDKASPVSDWELASRLSYFLWSSQPDDELRALATAGRLRDPDVLAAQAQRMLRDPKARRLATEFACQWLHIYEFDRLDEKSERHFPTFAALRGAMYEESILFFTDLFQNDRNLLNLLEADYTFLNEALAKHYGVPNVQGDQWRRVEGVKQYGRGGVLAQAATLAKQSGASRTSPILRGNWLSEVVLGEKLPRPPKDVPVLADDVPEGLTERQITERHANDPACAKCHVRIDPFGFALENYDAIGRFREKDASGLVIDAKTKVPDGTPIDGLAGLQKYLLEARKDVIIRQFNRKLLGYALGRSIRLSDEPLLTEMQAQLVSENYRVGAIVDLIVRSPQFRMIRGQDLASE